VTVDESGAPWPYAPPSPALETRSEPSWACPGGVCDCHTPSAEPARVPHRILFFDHDAVRLPGARCRVLEGGKLVNRTSPYADGAGALTVDILPTTRLLALEWAPADLPTGPRYPYRRFYHVDLGAETPVGVERRLANIGFSAHTTLDGNVRDFEDAYVLADSTTGDPEAVKPTLALFHDDGALPPLGTKVPPSPGATRSASLAKSAPDEAKAPGTVAQSPSGVAAAVRRAVLRLQVVRAFCLKKGDLTATVAPSPEALSDPDKLLDELYPSELSRTYRFPRSSAHAVKRASLTLYLDGVKVKTELSDDDGVASFDLSTAKKKGVVRIVALPPDENVLANKTKAKKKRLQLNRTLAPAGPAMTDENTSEEHLYRPFVVTLQLDADGQVALTSTGAPDASALAITPATCPAPDDGTGDVSPDAVTAVAAVSPPYVKRLDLRMAKEKAGDTPELILDWRPDWIRGKPDPRYSAWNRFQGKTVPADAPPAAIVIHQTHSTALWAGVVDSFLKRIRGTSIHYVVDLDGHAIKMLDEAHLANHAGESQWDGFNATSFFSVGIENLHSDVSPPGHDVPPAKYTPRDFPKEQYDGLIRLCKELQAAYGIQPANVFGHRDGKVLGKKKKSPTGADISYPGTAYTSRTHGGKPDCPGMFFDWSLLEAAGVALAPSPTPSRPFTGDPGEPSTPDELDDPALFDAAVMGLYMSPPAALNDPDKPAQAKNPSGLSKPALERTHVLLRRMLFDIGYSVSEKEPAPKRSELDSGVLDGPLLGAVQNFQTHHFSASRRRFRHELFGVHPPRVATMTGAPRIGHLESATIRAIIEVWWARGR
jgi:N-acetyl-anhydromuramyl-L-alanine amidase AmpD